LLEDFARVFVTPEQEFISSFERDLNSPSSPQFNFFASNNLAAPVVVGYHGESIKVGDREKCPGLAIDQEPANDWSGVIGNAKDHPNCIKFWEEHTGLKRSDVKCISKDCDPKNKVTMGIHIWSKDHLDWQWHFIAPSGAGHNSPNHFMSARGWFPARKDTSIVRSKCNCARLNSLCRPPKPGCVPHGDLTRLH